MLFFCNFDKTAKSRQVTSDTIFFKIQTTRILEDDGLLVYIRPSTKMRKILVRRIMRVFFLPLLDVTKYLVEICNEISKPWNFECVNEIIQLILWNRKHWHAFYLISMIFWFNFYVVRFNEHIILDNYEQRTYSLFSKGFVIRFNNLAISWFVYLSVSIFKIVLWSWNILWSIELFGEF